eukprot:TRINITY_DN1760_c0_g1_i1.p1 TRINITY_DN1760_c0_g1~~TRINITY_DN1760_c0_g1_i1.p1  ORF type:complete len:840 (+),score=175.13 TRINITY_DN1760_c0_g1_i1:317-2836(+)
MADEPGKNTVASTTTATTTSTSSLLAGEVAFEETPLHAETTPQRTPSKGSRRTREKKPAARGYRSHRAYSSSDDESEEEYRPRTLFKDEPTTGVEAAHQHASAGDIHAAGLGSGSFRRAASLSEIPGNTVDDSPRVKATPTVRRRHRHHQSRSPSPEPEKTKQQLFGITPWIPPKKRRNDFPTESQQPPRTRLLATEGDSEAALSEVAGSPKSLPSVPQKDESTVVGRFGINTTLKRASDVHFKTEGWEGLAVKLERFGNMMWVVFFGWWLALGYLLLAALCAATYIGMPYAIYARKMASYFFWPFGKYVVRLITEDSGEKLSLLQSSARARFLQVSVEAGVPMWQLYIRSTVWFMFTAIIMVPLHILAAGICWMLVVLIPMAKINIEAIDLLYNQPLSIDVYTAYPGPSANIIFCTYQAVNRYYYKYTLGGMNIVLVNLIPFVGLSLVLGYLLPAIGIHPNSSAEFIVSLISVIPTSYYMGMAVSSLAAQTSFAIGALLNATFGSFIELMLYYSAIRLGTLNDLVQASVIGTLLAMMLFLPGVSMVAGGLKYKEQRFNPASAGVSSVLLLISVIGAFTPTIFYNTFGSYVLECSGCNNFNSSIVNCSACTWRQGSLDADPAFNNAAKPLMYTCAAILPIGYIVGLIFTLRTHSHIFEEEQTEEEHEAPAWGIVTSIIILLASTIVFALISEELVDVIQPVLDALNIRQQFAGLTLIALIASFGEFVNAVQFAVNNNMNLSIEIALSASVQVVLIQFPILILLSALITNEGEPSFTLIFPALDLFAVIFSVTILNYITFDGKANYFQGAALIIIYALLVAAFWFVPNSDPQTPSSSSSS